MRELERLGLNGSHQVHIAPLVLRSDQRAHQVFLGFGDDTSSLIKELKSQYSLHTPAWLFRGDGREPLSISELESYKTESNDIIIIPAMQNEHPGGLYGLVWVVDRLLGPGGCPWDQEQTHESLRKHLIEECYELIQAIDENSDEKMKEELGDVLLQPIMHAQMEKLEGNWDIDEVSRGITDKLVRRHPHVFGDVEASDSDEVLKNWDKIKQTEKGKENQSVISGVPVAMPALLRAYEISKRAARCGFEWPDVEAVWQKLEEEKAELREAIKTGDKDEITSEVGDLLFTAVNIARWAGVDPENALRSMLDRFTARFQAMEADSTEPLDKLSAEEWDTLWEAAKSKLNTK